MVVRFITTPDGKVPAMSSENEGEEHNSHIYSGAALRTPEHWKTPLQNDGDHAALPFYKDEPNFVATTIYRRVQ